MNGFLRQRSGKVRNIRSFVIIAVDLLILGYALRSISVFFSPLKFKSNTSENVGATVSSDEAADVAVDVTRGLVVPEFQPSILGAPSCGDLKPEDVAYTLALHLSDTRMWMLQQHCALWGESAPISIAIWTSRTDDEIMESLKELGCKLEYITLHTLPSEGQSVADYPINTLRNLALSGVATSHVLLLDVDMLPSIDLFDTLNLPRVREAFANDPKLAVVVPAFETKDLNCGTSEECKNRHLFWMPRDFEDLVIGLGAHNALPYDATHFARQGSTNYRQWMKQTHGELVDIPCVSSHQYQPYMAVRLCNHLAPFQERFVGYGRNNMAWTMHLRRVGYRLQQVGGSFVAHFPHLKSQAKLDWETEHDPNEDAGGDLNMFPQDRSDKVLAEFYQWLLAKIDDESRVENCEDFEDEEKLLLVNEEA